MKMVYTIQRILIIFYSSWSLPVSQLTVFFLELQRLLPWRNRATVCCVGQRRQDPKGCLKADLLGIGRTLVNLSQDNEFILRFEK